MALSECTGTTPQEIFELAGISVTIPADIITGRGGSITKGTPNLQAIGAIGRNYAYVRALKKDVGRLLASSTRAKLNSPDRYYNSRTGNYQPYPPYDPLSKQSNSSLFLTLAQQIAVLVYNRVISPTAKLNVQAININTGDYCLNDKEENKSKIAEALRIPSHGLLQISDRLNNVNTFGHTYTAVDLTATAVFGNLVVPVKGLNGVSWSIHSDKNSDRRTFERKPGMHTRGAMTIAGSLIWALFDEDPIRAITPNEFFHGHIPIGDYSGFSNFDETLATEVPAFDLYIVFSNEYGATSSMTLWGVDITDTGGAVTIRQLENEIVTTYKAIGMEQLKPVKTTEEGVISFMDDFEGQDLFEQKRRANLYEDFASTNFEEMYNSALDTIAYAVQRRNGEDLGEQTI